MRVVGFCRLFIFLLLYFVFGTLRYLGVWVLVEEMNDDDGNVSCSERVCVKYYVSMMPNFFRCHCEMASSSSSSSHLLHHFLDRGFGRLSQ